MSTNESNGTPQLEFTWDPAKAASNITKHAVSFPQAAAVFADALALTVFDLSSTASSRTAGSR